MTGTCVNLATSVETELISGVGCCGVSRAKSDSSGLLVDQEPRVRPSACVDGRRTLCQYWASTATDIQPRAAVARGQEIGQAGGEETILSRK